jgi:hypothetical protein
LFFEFTVDVHVIGNSIFYVRGNDADGGEIPFDTRGNLLSDNIVGMNMLLAVDSMLPVADIHRLVVSSIVAGQLRHRG